MVGVTRFELVASSVSGKRSPPELNARSLGLPLSRQRAIVYQIGDCCQRPKVDCEAKFKFAKYGLASPRGMG